MTNIPTTTLFGLRIFSGKFEELADLLAKQLGGEVLLTLFTPNPEQVVLAAENSEFQKLLQSADLLIPDGSGLVWASQIFALPIFPGLKKWRTENTPIFERISGVEVVEFLLTTHPQLKYLVIGGKNYAKTQQSTFQIGNAKLHWIEGYADIQHPSTEEEAAVKKTLQDQKPDVVFVAFGAPGQEKWVATHGEILGQANVKLAMAVGGTFDELLGKVARTPALVDNLGFKWLHRLIIQPWRWKRQLKLLTFIKMTAQQLFKS